MNEVILVLLYFQMGFPCGGGSVEVLQNVSRQYVRERSLQKGVVFRFYYFISAASWRVEPFVSH